MKIRNKKLVNGIIATFLAVLLTGAAFAFASQGPLSFNGTATVNASLALAITQGVANPSTGAQAGVELTIPVTAANGSGHRVADMTAAFNGIDQYAVFNFTVTNIGTIPAQIAPIVLEFGPDSSDRLYWTESGITDELGGHDTILAPTESVEFSFRVAFDADGIDTWHYNASAEVSFQLNYGLVGSYVPITPYPTEPPTPPISPEPIVVPVNDISLTVSGGPAANPVTRVWTSFGTRGWQINPIPTDDGGFNMSRARFTENQNSWHRSGGAAQGQNADGTANIPRPVVNPGNMLAGITGLFPPGVPANQTNDRHVNFNLIITLEDGSQVTIAGVYNWQDNNRGNVGTRRYEFTTFSCETGRFVLTMRGWANSFEEWWLLDTSGVN